MISGSGRRRRRGDPAGFHRRQIQELRPGRRRHRRVRAGPAGLSHAQLRAWKARPRPRRPSRRLRPRAPSQEVVWPDRRPRFRGSQVCRSRRQREVPGGLRAGRSTSTGIPGPRSRAAYKAGHVPLGATVDRRTTGAKREIDPPGKPKGGYAIVTYQTKFANEAKCREEVVTLRALPEETWRVSTHESSPQQVDCIGLEPVGPVRKRLDQGAEHTSTHRRARASVASMNGTVRSASSRHQRDLGAAGDHHLRALVDQAGGRGRPWSRGCPGPGSPCLMR